MNSDAARRALRNLSSDETIKDAIISDKKVNKPIIDNINPEKGTKKMGRPRKDPGTKKEKIGVLLEPKYIEVLKKEAEDNEMDLSPYIASFYIVKVLKNKYKSLKK